jgi:nucleoside-diphosphate-sugar epimerase
MHGFEHQVHRSDITSIAGLSTDLLVCAGLPAEKWRANQDPESDWANVSALAQVLASVQADRAVLVSTIDVYQPAVGVDETTPSQLDGAGAYGAHRAWFEAFFQSHFSNALVLRLPALYAPDVRKNLVHDLLHGKADQWAAVNPFSTFQFFDATQIWTVIERAWGEGISLLNVTSGPVTAQAVADLFGVPLTAQTAPVHYEMRSIHAETLGGHDGFLFTADSILEGIGALRGASRP